MKHLYLPLIVSTFLLLGHVARAGSFDSETATVQKCKADGKCANVMIEKKSYKVPVTFEDGANWGCVKDHYELSDKSVAAVKGGHGRLKVAADGACSWKK